jgi:subtilisin family serine protease
MDRTAGRPEVVVGLIDGPVEIAHPDLAESHIQNVAPMQASGCSRTDSVACAHGTFVVGMIAARRSSPAPSICPDCTVRVRPIFPETFASGTAMPSASPGELASAIIDTIEAGARIINLSAALVDPFSGNVNALTHALDFAAKRGAIIVAAAGNQGTVGSSVITRHPWVIPVVGCDLNGRPSRESTLAHSIGRRGLSAPGENITSLGPAGKPLTMSGTSAAAPFVTGAIALLWSEFPHASALDVKMAITQGQRQATRKLVPPLLNAWGAFQAMASSIH